MTILYGWTSIIVVLAELIASTTSASRVAMSAGLATAPHHCHLVDGPIIPCATVVQGTPTTLTIYSYRSSAARFFTGRPRGRPTEALRVRNRADIHALVFRLNQMSPRSPGVVECGSGLARYDVLRFGYPDGDRWTVYFAFQCDGIARTHGVRAWQIGGAVNAADGAMVYLLHLFP